MVDINRLDLLDVPYTSQADNDDQRHVANLYLRDVKRLAEANAAEYASIGQVQKIHQELTPLVMIDHRQEVVGSIAHCFPWQEWFQVEGDRFRNIHTGARPLIAHGNGQTLMGWLPGGEL